MLAFLKTRCRTWHRSTWVVLALAALILALCNVPGQIEYESATYSHLAHGWPLHYLQRSLGGRFMIVVGGPGPGALTHTSPWRFWTDVTNFRPAYLAVDLITAAICLLLIGMLFQRWRARRQRIWQLHLRDYFALIFVVAAAAGGLAYEKRQYDDEQRTIEAMRRIESPKDPGVVIDVGLKLRGPFWLRELVGEYWPAIFDRVIWMRVKGPAIAYLHHFSHLKEVILTNALTDEQFRELEPLTGLDCLIVERTDLYYYPHENTTASLRIPNLPSLRTLTINETHLRGDGLEQLANVESLNLDKTEVNDAGIARLCNCPKLTSLSLSETNVTDEGLVHLHALTKLTYLDLSFSKITDAGLIHLSGLAQLEELNVDRTNLSEFGLEQLRKALPNCRIIADDLSPGFDSMIGVP